MNALPATEEQKGFQELLDESETHVAYWLEMIENCTPDQLAETISEAIRRRLGGMKATVTQGKRVS